MQINCTAVIGGPWTNQLVDSTSYGTSLIGSAQGRSRLLTIRICRLAISETLFDEAESVTFRASATAYTNDYKWNSCLLHSAKHRKQKARQASSWSYPAGSGSKDVLLFSFSPQIRKKGNYRMKLLVALQSSICFSKVISTIELFETSRIGAELGKVLPRNYENRPF